MDTTEPSDSEDSEGNQIVHMEYELEDNKMDENKCNTCESKVSDVGKVRSLKKQLNDTTDILIMDTGGGTNCTITKRAFHISDII